MDMCKGMRDLIEDSKKEGIKEGMDKSCLDSIKALCKNLHYTADKAMQVLDIPEKERAKYMAML